MPGGRDGRRSSRPDGAPACRSSGRRRVYRFIPLDHPATTPPDCRAAGSAIAEAECRVQRRQRRQQASIPLPAGFVAGSAVLCDRTVDLVDGQGRAVDVVWVADRGLAPLVAALQRPSERPKAGMICPAQLVIVSLALPHRPGRARHSSRSG
jgi:hypothetical protein